MSLRTYSHQLAALDAKAVKAWLQDASWKGRANKNNPRFYADVPADDSGPFAAIRKAIIDAINKAERKKRQKGKKVGRCARWVAGSLGRCARWVAGSLRSLTHPPTVRTREDVRHLY